VCDIMCRFRIGAAFTLVVFVVAMARLNTAWSPAEWDNGRSTLSSKSGVAKKAQNASLHCQQKRQQRCWQGAGSGSRGVELDSIVKLAIFSLENALKATDSDLRLQHSFTTPLIPRENTPRTPLTILYQSKLSRT
jgi:hypothetical protein